MTPRFSGMAIKKISATIAFVFFSAFLAGALYGYLQQKGEPPQQLERESLLGKAEVFNIFREDLTPEERGYYSDYVAGVAKQSLTLEVKEGCGADPLVLLVKKPGDSFFLRNQDSIEHIITFTQEKRYVLPPGGRQEVTVSGFTDKDLGFFGYGCDDEPERIGIIYVPDSSLAK